MLQTETLRTSDQVVDCCSRLMKMLMEHKRVEVGPDGPRHPLLSRTITISVQWCKGGDPETYPLIDVPEEEVRRDELESRDVMLSLIHI